jgi:IMP dehydrogenase
MARAGGLGVIHRNLTIEDQAAEVRRVKEAKAGEDGDLSSGEGEEKARESPAAIDGEGRLLAAAAIGVTGDWAERLDALVAAGLDVAVIDTAHGHSRLVLQAIDRAKARYPDLPLVAGNVATAEGTQALIEAGADIVKVGIGAGSICTTRIIAGVGVPQWTAIRTCVQVASEHGVPIIADGGMRFSGDVVKALAAGAHAVMLGSMLAGVDESPGDVIRVGHVHYKAYRGMGSLGAMQGLGRDRYGSAQGGGKAKLVPEGVEGCVPCRGPLDSILFQIVGGVRSGMGYLGAATLAELRERARFIRISHASLIESHPHSLISIEEAPNYGQGEGA